VSDPLASTDPSLGSQLMGDTDNYPDENQDCETVSCFDTTYAPVASVMPLDSGEMGVQGSNNTSGGFPLVQAFANWMDSHNESYYAAAWDTWSDLIGNYNGGSLNPYWGTWFYDHVTTPASTAMPLISRNAASNANVPVYYPGGPANGDTSNLVNNNNYTSSAGEDYGFTCPANFSGGNPNTGDCYVAENLSSVPAVQSGSLTQAYVQFDSGAVYQYDPPVEGFSQLGIPYNFTVQVNCTSLSQSTYPTSGWTTVETVTGNSLRTRAFLISMADPGASACNGNYNWVKLDVTQMPPNGFQNWIGKFEVWNASAGHSDSWMMYGDSITANDGEDIDREWGNAFAKQINAWNSAYYPAFSTGAYAGATAGDYASWLFSNTVSPPASAAGSLPWLPKNPAHFIALNLGTNDCNIGGPGPSEFSTSLTNIIDGILNADPTAVVIIPSLPPSGNLRSGTNQILTWTGSGSQSDTTNYTNVATTGNGAGPICNTDITNAITTAQQKYGAAHVMAGPDLWNGMMGSNVEWNDNQLHPALNVDGYGIMRNLWVQWAETHIYSPH
jgi:hypothetical protein